MIAVIFEVFPKEGKWDEYLDIAAFLRPELNKIAGFISVERFQSMTNKNKVLSLSFWKDEESVAQWRNVELHRQAQANGRSNIFNDYRLRVAHVLRDYTLTERRETPADSLDFHKK
jgi:heme-degrading monooxygenase HmoA